MSDWIAAILLVLGSAFMLIAAVGVVRFPDLIIRMHAATKAGGPGVGLVVIAVAVHFAEAQVTTRAALVAVFLLLTAPVAAHLIARAAYLTGVPLWSGTTLDEMRRRAARPRPRPGGLWDEGGPPREEAPTREVPQDDGGETRPQA